MNGASNMLGRKMRLPTTRPQFLKCFTTWVGAGDCAGGGVAGFVTDGYQVWTRPENCGSDVYYARPKLLRE